jgi:hypothetical protein
MAVEWLFLTQRRKVPGEATGLAGQQKGCFIGKPAIY